MLNINGVHISMWVVLALILFRGLVGLIVVALVHNGSIVVQIMAAAFLVYLLPLLEMYMGRPLLHYLGLQHDAEECDKLVPPTT